MKKHIGILAALLLTCSSLAAQEEPAQGQGRFAVVEFSADFMREEPDYAAELGNQALMGTIVEMIDTQSYWVKIKSPEPYVAWVNAMGLVPMTDRQLEDYLSAPKYICTSPLSHVYEEPSRKSRIVSELVMGDIVRIMYKTVSHTWGRYKGMDEGRAVLRRKFCGVVLPSGKTGYVPREDLDVFYKWAKDKKSLSDRALREALVETAELFLGVPYMWGGTSVKNVDCSGLTRSVFFSNGILLPRNASQQARVGEDLAIFDPDGNVVWDNLLPGDLVFWGRPATAGSPERISHVGMYIGDGRFIHSSQVVRINSLDSGAPDYYDRRPVRARRVVGHVDEDGSGIVSTFQSGWYFAGR